MEWQMIGSLAAIATFGVSLAVLQRMKQLTVRLDAVEVDRAGFVNKRTEQIDALSADLWEVRNILKDLVDFQKADGRYRHDPNDPRLPAHLRDQTGRED